MRTHTCILQKPMQSRSWSSSDLVHVEVYSIQHYVIKFVKDLRQVGGVFWRQGGTPVSSTNRNDAHDITETLLKMALNAITLTLTLLIIVCPLLIYTSDSTHFLSYPLTCICLITSWPTFLIHVYQLNSSSRKEESRGSITLWWLCKMGTSAFAARSINETWTLMWIIDLW